VSHCHTSLVPLHSPTVTVICVFVAVLLAPSDAVQTTWVVQETWGVDVQVVAGVALVVVMAKVLPDAGVHVTVMFAYKLSSAVGGV
jgi:hypothetical protein